MTDYPRTRELLVELLGLDELDAQLPLELLLNLHRTRLQSPLLQVLHVSETLPPDEDPVLVLRRRYPLVRGEVLFEDDEGVQQAVEAYYVALRAHSSVDFEDIRVEELSSIVSVSDDWYAAFTLYLLGYPYESRQQGIDLMEQLLGTHPAVALMLRDLAEAFEVPSLA